MPAAERRIFGRRPARADRSSEISIRHSTERRKNKTVFMKAPYHSAISTLSELGVKTCFPRLHLVPVRDSIPLIKMMLMIIFKEASAGGPLPAHRCHELASAGSGRQRP